MKASKIILSLFILTAVGLFIPQMAFCQTEKLGMVQYTPPKDWKKTANENVVVFSELNQTTGRFCIITLYGATASSGNPQSDFITAWNSLAVKNMNAKANPETETQTADGWTIIAGASAMSSEGIKGAAFLTVISGFGKTVSILAAFNDPNYLDKVTAFVSAIDLDKTAQVMPPVSTPSVANQSNQSGKFGLMTYTAPAGWTEQIFTNGVLFKPSDLPTGEVLMIQIMLPLNASGTLEQALAQSYSEAATMYKGTLMNYAGSGKNYATIEAKTSFQGWEYIRGNGGIKLPDGTEFGTEFGLELFVIKVNNRFERVAILESKKNCRQSSYKSSDRITYRNGIENLLFSLQFTDADYAELKSGSTKGAGIVGIWQGVIQGTGMAGATGVSIESFSPVFLTNGQVYFGGKFPIEGFDGLNTRIPPEQSRRDWGTYTFSNGRGLLKMPYGEYPFRIDGNKLVITKNQMDWSFVKMNQVDGATFNGTYTIVGAGGKISSITFTSDGRFADNGAIQILSHQTNDCLNPATNAGSGTYEVKDYTINFNYSDGRKFKLAFIGYDYDKSNPSPAILRMSFNDDKLIKQ